MGAEGASGAMSLMGKLSIRYKLVLIIMAISALSMILASGALLVYQEFSFRQRMIRDLETQALMLAANCTAALAFDVRQDAEDLMEVLRVKTTIMAAGVYREDKTVLASYERNAGSTTLPPRAPDVEGHRFEPGGLIYVRHVTLDGERLGTIYLKSDLSGLTAFRRDGLLALVFMILLASIVAYALSSMVQKVISEPIFELSRTARAVTVDADYSIRAQKHTDDELGLLTDAFNNMLAQVEKTVALEAQLRHSQKMEAIGRLAGGIAHDFNNLLQVIASHVHFLRQKSAAVDRETDIPSVETAAEDLVRISKATESASLLTQQLLAFSRQAVVHLESLDMNRVAEEAIAMVRRTIGEDIEVSFRRGADLWPIRADAGQVQQVIVNLAVNARDAMPAGGKLSFLVANVGGGASGGPSEPQAAPGDCVMLQVADTGVGMDEEVKARAFEPFFTTKEAGRGTGLGLATVFGIVEQTGGRIEVDSKLGQGTTFRIYFPRSEQTEPASADVRRETVDRGGRGELLLLVEDEPTVRVVTRRILRQAGYRVLEAADAGEACTLFEESGEDVALLITDVVMPGRRGDDLAKDLARRKPDLQILFMTGYAPRAGEGGFEGGTWLKKPFVPDLLLQKVALLLTRRSTGSEEQPSTRGLLLLVDDEPAILSSTRRILVQMGYEVEVAKDGRRALELFSARAGDFAAVILDWVMPGMNGEETLKGMLEVRPEVRAVITSGDSTAAKRYGDKAGIAFLQKPFCRDELAAKLQEVGFSMRG